MRKWNGWCAQWIVLLVLGSFGVETAAFQAIRASSLVYQRDMAPLSWRKNQLFDYHRSQATMLRSIYMNSEQASDDEQQTTGSGSHPLRDRLRRATGFSLTAFRAAVRAATGVSLTAIYGTTVAASGLWIRKTTSVVMSVFPAWFRYFLQPLLIAYYLPMFIIRGLTGPTRKQARAKHEAVKESWREAIHFAKQAKSQGYWPVQLNCKRWEGD